MPFAKVNQFDMHYEDTGKGEPLVFVHGWISTGSVWDATVRELEISFRCLVPEGRGASESGRPTGGHSIASYADDLLAFADALGLERFTVVGHSMGGVIGTAAALKAPERVERLVMVASTPDASYVADGIWNMLIGLSDVLAEGNQDAAQAFITGITARRDGAPIQRLAEGAVSCSREFICDSIRDCAQFRPGEAIDSLAVPTLVVGGSADPFLPASIAAFNHLPNSALHVFNRTAHGIPWEVPGELAALIADFAKNGVVTAESLAAA